MGSTGGGPDRLVQRVAPQTATRGSEPVGDLDVVDARADSGNGEVFAGAPLEEAVAEEDATSFKGEAVAVVPVVKHPGQTKPSGSILAGRVSSRSAAAVSVATLRCRLCQNRGYL